MSNLKKLSAWAAGAALAGIISVVIVNSTAKAGSSSTPGSANDPIVTKSYVDQKIAELARGGGISGAPAAGGGAIAPLEVVVVPLDKTIMVKAGGELVVRTGKAIAVSNDANGLSDMTDGVDIAPGKPVGTNHLILFPRDGRGVKADPASKTELIVLVRGGYELK